MTVRVLWVLCAVHESMMLAYCQAEWAACQKFSVAPGVFGCLIFRVIGDLWDLRCQIQEPLHAMPATCRVGGVWQDKSEVR